MNPREFDAVLGGLVSNDTVSGNDAVLGGIEGLLHRLSVWPKETRCYTELFRQASKYKVEGLEAVLRIYAKATWEEMQAWQGWLGVTLPALSSTIDFGVFLNPLYHDLETEIMPCSETFALDFELEKYGYAIKYISLFCGNIRVTEYDNNYQNRDFCPYLIRLGSTYRKNQKGIKQVREFLGRSIVMYDRISEYLTLRGLKQLNNITENTSIIYVKPLIEDWAIRLGLSLSLTERVLVQAGNPYFPSYYPDTENSFSPYELREPINYANENCREKPYRLWIVFKALEALNSFFQIN